MIITCRILNCLAIIALLLSAVGNFLTYIFWTFVLDGVFKMFLFLILIVTEIGQSPTLVKPLSFLFYFGGRGMFYIFLGLMTLGLELLSLIGGFLLLVIGLIYVGLHLSRKGKEPEFMSFKRYQRLTSGLSHEPPATTVNNQHQTYPVANQIPLHQQPRHASDIVHQQDIDITTNMQSAPVSLPQDKTEV